MNAPIVIGSRYELIEFIGKGGMGRVYKGLDRQTGDTVAVKALKADVLAALQLERFRREAETLRMLEHPNIVSFLDAVEEPDGHYIVMEYVGGGSLEQLLEREGPLPLDRALNIALDLADALTRAHRLDIIHRDIKPANVLIAADGTPRLSDFGLARTGGPRITETGVIMGTVHYMCPEGINGERLTALADIWALGIILFEMVAAQHPFLQTRKDSLPMIMLAIMQQPVPDLELLRPGLPIALVDLIYRMLAKECEARIPSARLVGAALEAILHGGDLDAATSGAFQAMPDRQATQALRFATPTSPTDAGPRHSLPAPPTPFLGRESELGDLDALLVNPQARLVTILGPGGMGKTRLALAAASRLLDNVQLWPYITDGLYFVDLAPLTEGAQIVPAIAESVGCQFQQGDDLQSQLLSFLQEKHLLLLLDNYEHLIGSAGLARTLLESAPGLQLLVTSRERLNLPEETVYRVGGMTFPERPVDADPSIHSAVRLFLQAVHRVRPDFEPTRAHIEAIGLTCRLLDGMPLAVELAAAWITLLSPQEIAAEIMRSADFLETDQRGVPDRHRSIRAVFDYSWDKLIEAERDAFMQLAVFRGGFTREAAEAVAGASLRTLMTLINKSLLRRDAASGRFYLHELLRQYGLEQLAASGAQVATEARHSAFFVAWAERSEQPRQGPDTGHWLAATDEEYPNLRLVLERAFSGGDPEDGLRVAKALWWYWWMRGLWTEGYAWFTTGLEQSPEASALRAYTLHHAGHFAMILNLPPAHDYNAEMVALAEQLNLPELIAFGYFTQSESIFDYAEAVALLEKAAATLPPGSNILIIIITLAARARLQGRVAEADAHYAHLHDLYEAAPVLHLKLEATGMSGRMAVQRGDYAAAEPLLDEALQMARQANSQMDVAEWLIHRGLLALYQGDGAEAERLISECLERWQDISSNSTGMAHTLQAAAYVALVNGDVPLAAARIGQCLRTNQSMNGFGAVEFAVVRLFIVAKLAQAAGDPVQAARLLGAAAAMRDLIEYRMDAFVLADFERTVAEVQAALAPEAFAAAWANGGAVPLPETMPFALAFLDSLDRLS